MPGNGQTLSVTFTPTDTMDYNTAAATATINVRQATPTITWANPADITYGTALGATQLDATASVPGTFSVHARQRDGARCGQRPDALGHLHAHRHHRLHHGHRHGDDQRREGNALHHLGQSRGHHLRHGAGVTPSSMRPRPCPAHSPTPRPRDGARRGKRPDALGLLHAYRHHRLHHGHRHGDDQRRRRQRRPSPGPIPPTSPTARRLLGQLDATASVPGTFTYTPAAGTVLDARKRPDALGVLHAYRHHGLHHGHRKATINVDKATPSITWAKPADITYGTALVHRPARCDRVRAGHVHVHPGTRDGAACRETARRSRSPSRLPTPPITPRPPPQRRSTSIKQRPPSPGPIPPTSPTARRCPPPSSMRRHPYPATSTTHRARERF